MTRTEEDVQKYLERAKLEADDLMPLAQPLYFSDDSRDDLILMEVDKDMLKSLRDGEGLVFRGQEDDAVVACTSEHTFEVREADISNSLLLVADLGLPTDITSNSDGTRQICSRQVSRSFHDYLELRPCCPRLRKLVQLLRECTYRGLEYEDDETRWKYTFGDILDEVQASEAELRQAIEELPVVEIDGFYRLLELDYHFRVQNFIVNYIEAESLPMSRIPAGEVVDKVSELEPREIVAEVFRRCTTPNEGDEFYSLNYDVICRTTAETLLRTVGKFNLSEFLEVWQNSVPEGLRTDMRQLEGLALTDSGTIPESIHLFDKWDLPEDATERFDHLFRAKKRWTLNEIRPYIRDLCVAGQKADVNALLMKHARAAMRNGARTYTAKRPVR
uniref:Sister chromatid cohesion protein DCC1 n=1 Tax=Ixodes ricinus TaxID=34613 RepID=V5I0E0_IXORI